jgi:hypothetical protein
MCTVEIGEYRQEVEAENNITCHAAGDTEYVKGPLCLSITTETKRGQKTIAISSN